MSWIVWLLLYIFLRKGLFDASYFWVALWEEFFVLLRAGWFATVEFGAFGIELTAILFDWSGEVSDVGSFLSSEGTVG